MTTRAASLHSLWKPLALAALTVAAVALAWKALPVTLWIRAFLGSVSDLGFWGPLAYGFVYVVASLLGMPRTPLNIGAGIVFSFPVALVVVLVCATITFVLTFEIARHVASDWVARKIDAVPNARRIMEAVEREGFKLVLLLRMNPFLPAVVKGYGFGTTSLPMSTYLVASILGFLPIGVAHVYLGWLGGAAMMVSSAQPAAWRSALLIGGGLVSLLLIVFVTWFANRALNKRTAD